MSAERDENIKELAQEHMRRKLWALIYGHRLKKSSLLRNSDWVPIAVIVLPRYLFNILVSPGDHDFLDLRLGGSIIVPARDYRGYRKTVTYDDLY